MQVPQQIIISRTDSIGDVVLTLPMLGVLKQHFPEVQLIFLGSAYTRAVVEKCAHADFFWDWQQTTVEQLATADAIVHVFPRREVAKMAKEAKIPIRIGTGHRLFHWRTCNKRVNFSRKNSPLHEAQLNLKLLTPLFSPPTFSLTALADVYGWKPPTGSGAKAWLTPKFNLIFHIKSKGSAKEWGAEKFLQLAKELPPAHFQVFISGTADEGQLIHQEIPQIFDFEHVTDMTGKFGLGEFIDFVQQADGLLACSTGPLHLAAASGIRCLGLYPANRPMHAGRWAPVGKKAQVLNETNPNPTGKFLDQIGVEQVKAVLLEWIEN